MTASIIIQARMGSSRLPGKVLEDISGQPMLQQMLNRLMKVQPAHDIVVATTVNEIDDPIVALANRAGVRWYRGSERDVLGRYFGAAQESKADVVLRVTSDCPLIDPDQVALIIQKLEADASAFDYVSNVVERTLPRGLDCEGMHFDVLRRLNRMARSELAREHVTYFLLKERPDLFCVGSVIDSEDNSDLRWTVDTKEDLLMVRKIYSALDLGSRVLPFKKVIAFVRDHPEIVALNAGIRQKE